MKKLLALFPLMITAACGAYQPAACELDNSCPQWVSCNQDGTCQELLVLAAADYYATGEDRILFVPVWRGLLANDAERTGAGLEARVVTPPLHGSLSLERDGAFVYEPHPEFAGEDSFEYRATSGPEMSPVSRVLIRVVPENDHRPVTREDIVSVAPGGLLSREASRGVLANDADPDGDRIDAMLDGGPAHGRLWLRADGSFTYMPEEGFTGSDSFTYRAWDGVHESEATRVTVRVGIPLDVRLDVPASRDALTAAPTPPPMGELGDVEAGAPVDD